MNEVLHIQVNLRPFHSFGCDVWAAEFGVFDSQEGWKELIRQSKTRRRLVLGGGSNVLFSGDYDGCVLQNAIKGISIVEENDEHVYIRVGAGENWHELVLHTVQKGWGGLENLSLIPGCVGASPMQNIGAYGVEVKQTISTVEAWHKDTLEWMVFSNADCQFGYRESIFKTSFRNQLVIAYVTFKLSRQPVVQTSYGAIREALQASGVVQPTIQDVSDAVIKIRQSKLPNPRELGNAGSFFKNPVIPASQAADLLMQYPNIPLYDAQIGYKKLAAGWLIEQCGLKGYRDGDAGVHTRQALVLVNYGKANGPQLLAVARLVQDQVLKRFGVHLEQEVNLID
jgi:UDP-N-acetylmuramate dehydrogenase